MMVWIIVEKLVWERLCGVDIGHDSIAFSRWESTIKFESSVIIPWMRLLFIIWCLNGSERES